MADINSGLPIRTQLPGQANYDDTIVKIADASNTAQLLGIDANGRVSSKLFDGAGTAITSQVNGSQQALDVGINVAGVQIDPRSIRALTASDVVTANQGDPNTNSNAWFTRLTDGTNDSVLLATGELTVAVTQLLPEDHDYGAVGADTLRTAAQVGNATGAADFNNGATGAQTLRVAANLALSGTDVSAANPIPVAISVNNAGDEINDYNTASAVAANATSNHDYTVSGGKTLLLTQIECSATGRSKAEIQIETGVATGVFTTKFVQFSTTSDPNISLHLKSPIAVAAGVKVRVIRTNRDNLAMDLYSTICGQEI